MFSTGTSRMKRSHMQKTVREKSTLDKEKHKVVSEVRTVRPSPDTSATVA